MIRVLEVSIVTLLVAPLAGAAHAQTYATAGGQQYLVTDIGVLSTQHPYNAVGGINASGQVVGTSLLSDGVHGGGYYYPGNGTPLVNVGNLGGAYVNSQALAVNSSSWVVGQSYTDPGDNQGFVWTSQTGMHGIGFLPGGTDSELQSISDTNVAVGLATPAGASVGQPVIWDPTNGLRDLKSSIVNPPTTWTLNDAEAISPNGAFIAGIGWSNTTTSPPSGAEHAFVLSGNTLTEVPDPGTALFPEAINSSGQTTGFYYNMNGHTASFVNTNASGTIDIGNLGILLAGSGSRTTEALGESDLGAVVGADYWNSGQQAAFLWTKSVGMTEIYPSQGITFDGAFAINDAGIIAANGFYNNGTPPGYRTFVLTPIPEPTTIALFAACSAVILTARFRRIRRTCFARKGTENPTSE